MKAPRHVNETVFRDNGKRKGVMLMKRWLICVVLSLVVLESGEWDLDWRAASREALTGIV
jgi:hypothetical protein